MVERENYCLYKNKLEFYL